MRNALPVILLLALAACKNPTVPQTTSVATAKPQETVTPTPKPDPDRELAARVKRALENEATVQAGAIDVAAADGVITLWGTSAATEERKRAEAIATKVTGVKSVENKLAVVRGS